MDPKNRSTRSPDKKPVLLRTPAYLKSYTGLEYKDIAALTPERGSDIGRLGFYNDGYMGSDSDLGTWMEDTLTRKEGIDYLGRVGSQVFYGGEYSGGSGDYHQEALQGRGSYPDPAAEHSAGAGEQRSLDPSAEQHCRGARAGTRGSAGCMAWRHGICRRSSNARMWPGR